MGDIYTPTPCDEIEYLFQRHVRSLIVPALEKTATCRFLDEPHQQDRRYSRQSDEHESHLPGSKLTQQWYHKRFRGHCIGDNLAAQQEREARAK